MARRPEVSYWATRGMWVDQFGKFQKGGYWTTINGKKCPLAMGPKDEPKGPTYLKALKEFTDLLAMEGAPAAGDRNTCRVVCEYYLRALADAGQEVTLALRQEFLDAFVRTDMGDLPVARLTPFMVQQWLSDMRKPREVEMKPRGKKTGKTRTFAWGDGRVRIAVQSLKAAFNHGARYGLISRNPIAALPSPPATSRARGCLVRPDLHQTILRRTRGQFREAIICLENCGCRPGELLNATAADWDDRLCALVYHARKRRRPGEGSHKTAAKEKERRIFFTGEAASIMRRRVREHPRGRLWRNPKRDHLPLERKRLGNSFVALGRRLGIPGLCAYSYRHTFATIFLESGEGSIDDLAELMGNTPEVIRHHYAHLCDNVDRLKGLADKFNAARTEKPNVLPFDRAAQ